jgi:hypothetical protein
MNTEEVCTGCLAELLELRRMVLDELPVIEDNYKGAYVAVNVRDLGLVKSWAAGCVMCDHP